MSLFGQPAPPLVQLRFLKEHQNGVWLKTKADSLRRIAQRPRCGAITMGEQSMSSFKTFVAGLGVATFLASGLATGSAFAGDAESCKTVRLSDVGWTDIQATTGVASVLLTALGYDPGPVDGVWGPRTQAAVQKFESDQGLAESDGQVGPETRAALAAGLDAQGLAHVGE